MSNTIFPKTLEIRNTVGGAIWQIYHVNNQQEIDLLSETAQRNGFYSQTVTLYQPDVEETWPGWRETEGWKSRLEQIKGNKSLNK